MNATRFLAVIAALIASTAAFAEGSSIGHGQGGRFIYFDPIVAQYNRTGELFRIKGHCRSACTLFLAIRNVCIERTATLLFHAGRDRRKGVSAWGTEHMQGAYNARLRQFVRANHYMDTFEFHAISGSDMITKFGYRECPR
jgi:hypothetical protein